MGPSILTRAPVPADVLNALLCSRAGHRHRRQKWVENDAEPGRKSPGKRNRLIIQQFFIHVNDVVLLLPSLGRVQLLGPSQGHCYG